jgi:hypothetical protein
MKHPSNRELFEYWNTRRGRRSAPDRNEIEPGAIRHLLADTFILAFDASGGHPFRLAGTRVCALFGRNLKGASFLDLWAAASRGAVEDLLTVAADESVGAVARTSAAGADDLPYDLELLILPLSHRGRMDARILGALAPTDAPHWPGAGVLGGLTLGTLRYVGGDAAVKSAPRIVSVMPKGHIRHGLVVYDGGQT